MTTPLRLWPGVVAAVLLIVLRFGVPLVFAEAGIVAILGALVCSLAIIVWWLFFSRAPWVERLGALGLVIIAMAATYQILHPSIAGGNMGLMYFLYAPPYLALALVLWAVATRRLSVTPRRLTMAVTIMIACGAWALLRTDGVMGLGSELHWRWTPTAEQRLLAQTRDEQLAAAPAAVPAASPAPIEPAAEPAAVTVAAAAVPDTPAPAVKVVALTTETPAEWPGFRGPDRNGVIRNMRIATDWTTSPPAQLWRRPIGPGWSSFAVQGDLLYTQEQRGDDEIVSAYRVSTGEPVWRHRDPVRFYESNGGAGPRATPTLSGGRVYAFGATGILNALDARTGAVIWSRNAGTDAGRKVPTWGYASSPLVVGDLVVVAAASKLVGYDRTTGTPRWFGPDRGGGYSSPQLVTIGGVKQIVLLTSAGATSVAPEDGTVLWEHAWEGTPIMQPAMTEDGDILITVTGAASGYGTRRLAVTKGPAGWTAVERWTSIGLKPYFNDYVVHNGHAYGFDGAILSSIDLKDGTRKWKGGRYGNGQMALLADQDLLLVISEDGDLVLVSATPDKFTEVAKVPALDGKTWNHPVVVGDVLLVRNGQEMAAFRLTRAGS